LQAVTNRVNRKIVIVFEAGKALFLRRGDDFAVNHKTRC
jgi:hypothetical protein